MSFFTSIQAFFQGAVSDVQAVAEKVETGLEGLAADEQAIVDAAPNLAQAVETILTELANVSAEAFSGIETLISDGNALLTALESIFETTGSAAPGGESTT